MPCLLHFKSRRGAPEHSQARLSVGELSLPSCRPGVLHTPCCLSSPYNWSQLTCRVQRQLQPQKRKQKVEAPLTWDPAVPRSQEAAPCLGCDLHAVFGAAGPWGSGPVPPHGAEVCLCGKCMSRDSLGATLITLAMTSSFPCSHGAPAVSFNIKSFFI